MPKDRRESNKKYYENHKRKWKKYKRKARIKAEKKTRGSYYTGLSNKQKAFKKSVEQGIDPAEAVKRAYPGITNISEKLTEFRHNPVLDNTMERFKASMVEAGFTPKYEAESKFAFAERAHEKDSTPHDVRNAIIVFQDWDKARGLTIERSESRSLNINITVTPEQAKHMESVPEEEIIDVEESDLEKEKKNDFSLP